MDYSFNLEWNELSEELQNQKIDEVIEFDFKVGDIDNLDNYEDEPKTLQEQLENDELRDRISEYISMHFPIYF